ncbi:efflux transporter, outer membrane factor (OMF) lipoprotein, NodT family [Polynucleobacter meluiroseus]|uniref:Efflux transporter, outer membrane factor (OMF) lipoprotein, NodT family n=1 Tax=Polynucleobacter meluiroseus TaxID=1938814 RepID=A0A240E4E9_9BURK|nr:efflux transporter outer membrane subunit [Polynucleobacter meluiroseus]SNX29396.1 efflux transporter, outer membrane factor (OMF) lipoprotein, NodT family [Polynucleobacter meluiroseus]
MSKIGGMKSRQLKSIFSGTALIALLTGCMVGPDYTKPDSPVAPTYKELGENASGDGWKLAEPNEAGMDTQWWKIYRDPVLDELMANIAISNQNVIATEAQYRQATALLTQARAGLFPTLTGNAGGTRGTASNNNGSTNSVIQSSNANIGASWIPDIWGQVRRNVEAGGANAQASAAQIAAITLSTQATLAQTYFALRIADMQTQMYAYTIDAYQKSLTISQNQYDAGIVTQLDVAQAQTLLESTKALAIDLQLSRAQLEHALAVLVGQTPSSFSLPAQVNAIDPQTGLIVSPVTKLVASLPDVPIGIPSQLLERRPDIAAAERQMAAANARIGVATAAFFPTLTISGAGGFQGVELPNLISMPLRYWSWGPALSQPLFDGGLRVGALRQADAAYDQNVALYRQTVLSAFQNVEDNLVALRLLQSESKAQASAVKYAQTAVRISLNQYKSGIVTYLNVSTAQATELSNERTLMSLLNRQIAAHVGLITSLGGGWDASLLANK